VTLKELAQTGTKELNTLQLAAVNG